MSGVAVDVRDLGLAYGSRTALHHVNLHIEPGERVAVLGPNGAGKSSLLRCVSGAAAPSDGSVAVDGRPLASYSRAELARTIAVVPGQTVVTFPLPVEELVELGRLPHEHPLLGPRAADRAAVAAAIERVGIGHLVGRDVRQLSLGERQLAVLAMSIAQAPRLLLLDEPTVHLDLRHQVRVMELLTRLSRVDGVTVVAVLHDLALASRYFDRVAVLDGGELVSIGTPDDVLTPSRLRDLYGTDLALFSLPPTAPGVTPRAMPLVHRP
jgi:iron complex transport system ATP-binding protein